MTTTATALSRYPRSLAGGLTVRPLRSEDESALVDFFRRIPVDERRLFKDDVTRPAVVQGWIRNLNYENILPLLAFDGRRVVADATLHRDRRGWSRHVAKIRITLDPEFRRRGLARALIREFIDLAPALRVALLHAEVLDVQKGARALFEDLGFECVATLPQHAIDFAGHVHDILVYCLVVTPPERVAADVAPVGEDADTGGAD
jgi:RimJ/RimL family protein N-acetyltransferase